MLFSSHEFLFLFLPITFFIYFTVARFKERFAILWMILASLFFYAWWNAAFVWILSSSVIFNYFIARKLLLDSFRKIWLAIGLSVNFLALGYFKYTVFFFENFCLLFPNMTLDVPQIVLPLGISFFTFTQSAFLIDVYRGETKDFSFVYFLEFVLIFPHLIAGPIIHHKSMFPQFRNLENYNINYDNIAKGITVFVIGLFKKVAIADTLSPWVLDVFSRADQLTFLEAWIGALAYSLQLYFDFSGYSEMAIGLGLMFNINFPVNFNSPYQASSIIDFWRRWHMTLGFWVKNYLYIPLGGSRLGKVKQMRNLFLSMLIIGFWHGAGWNFVLWGGAHGLLLVLNHLWRSFGFSLHTSIAKILTFLCVVFCWVFFRADNLQSAISIVSSMLDLTNIVVPKSSFSSLFMPYLSLVGIDIGVLAFSTRLDKVFCFISFLLLVVWFLPNPLKVLTRFRPSYLYLFSIFILFLLALFRMNEKMEFLYFQF